MDGFLQSFVLPVHAFLVRHGYQESKPTIKIRKGYFIAPRSVINLKTATNINSIILDDLSLQMLYDEQYPEQMDGLRKFLEINGITSKEGEFEASMKTLAILTYMVCFYLRRFKGQDVKNLPPLDGKMIKLVTPQAVVELYSELDRYLGEKGLSEDSSNKILLASLNDYGSAVKNILNILNARELNYQADAEAVRKRLAYDCGYFLNVNPLNEGIGNLFQGYVCANSEKIKRRIQAIMGSTDSVLMPFDTGNRMKHKLMQQQIKAPDFFFLDNNLNLLGIDVKTRLHESKDEQVGVATTAAILQNRGFLEKIATLSPRITPVLHFCN